MAQNGNRKKAVSGSGPVLADVSSDERILHGKASSAPLPESLSKTHHVANDKKSKQTTRKPQRKENQDEEPPISSVGSASNYKKSIEGLSSEQGNDTYVHGHASKDAESSSDQLPNGSHRDRKGETIEFSSEMVVEHMRTILLSVSRASHRSLERLTPIFITFSTKFQEAFSYAQRKIEIAYTVSFKWIMHFGSIMLLLLVLWLGCALRGVESLLRMGRTSFLAIVWCSVLSVIAVVGIFKFLLFLAIAVVIGLFIGFPIALLLIAISGAALLWLYGSFWMTMLILFLGGLAFLLNHEPLALFITTMYSVSTLWTYVGWLGVVLAFNLSFISSDVLTYFMRSHMNGARMSGRPPEQASGIRGQPGFFSGEPAADGLSANQSLGVPSTSGSAESGITSEDEVARLLNCTDHYSALGLSRFENVDASILKREYKKKAMLVHPDKNMGDEKAAEAFKKLQGAYEVLLDAFKRKAYDDDLRTEELLNYIHRFQNASEKRRHGLFRSAFARTETVDEDIPGESRRIACRKCGFFHLWLDTKKSKSKARWCQECKDCHPAKDGDGWVEQSSRPFLFGILQKIDVPAAYVCASGRIYDATEWYICQGMKCAVNTHKPSFHVNTNITSKHNNGKGTSSGRRGGAARPNMDETMTEEELFEWLRNAAQAGTFENFAGTASESPSAQPPNTPKSNGSNSGSGNSKRKKKAKKH